MSKVKLNQVLAIEKDVKSRSQSTVSKIYHQVQKLALLNGFSKSYEPLDEEGMRYPPEHQQVAVKSGDVLRSTRDALSELFNITAQKDIANCSASADVIVDGQTIGFQLPVTYLLFLEKQLTDLHTLLGKIPELDASESWNWDEASSLYKSTPVKSTRTQKIQKPVVLYPATEEHPAQTQLVTEDQVVGTWTTVKHSGALTVEQKRKLLDRVNKLRTAVKFAREEANSVEAKRTEVGTSLLRYIFGD